MHSHSVTPGHFCATLKDARSVRRLLEQCGVQWVTLPSDPPEIGASASTSACSTSFDTQDLIVRQREGVLSGAILVPMRGTTKAGIGPAANVN